MLNKKFLAYEDVILISIFIYYFKISYLCLSIKQVWTRKNLHLYWSRLNKSYWFNNKLTNYTNGIVVIYLVRNNNKTSYSFEIRCSAISYLIVKSIANHPFFDSFPTHFFFGIQRHCIFYKLTVQEWNSRLSNFQIKTYKISLSGLNWLARFSWHFSA